MIQYHRDDKLTKEEELQLGEKIQQMRKIKERQGYDFFDLNFEEKEIVEIGEEALETLVRNYIKLAIKYANTFHKKTGTKYEQEDLVQDAIGALIDAANNYNPSKDCKLGTFAYYKITKKISSTINFQRLVRMPENKMGEYILITRAQKEYNELSDPEKEKYLNELDYVYKNVGLKKNEVDLILENMQSQVSLETPINEGEGILMDLIADNRAHEELSLKEDLHHGLERIISKLTPFQKDLIAYEFGIYPPSMPYSEFLSEHNLDDKKVKREINKTITLMSNIAKKNKITIDL